MSPKAALGFRVHSGWAAAVAVSGTSTDFTVVEKRRITIANSSFARKPYHHFEEMPVDKAEQYLARSRAISEKLAQTEIEKLL